jgi:hypothetical protein
MQASTSRKTKHFGKCIKFKGFLRKKRYSFFLHSFSVLENFAPVLVQTIRVQPSVCTVLNLTFPVLINPIAESMAGVRERTDPAAFPAVIVIRIEVNLAPVTGYPVAVIPPKVAFFNVTNTA